MFLWKGPLLPTLRSNEPSPGAFRPSGASPSTGNTESRIVGVEAPQMDFSQALTSSLVEEELTMNSFVIVLG